MEQVNSTQLRIRVGYGPDLLDYSSSHKFFVRFEALIRHPLSPFEEAIIAAKEISTQLGPSLTLCLSGGLDSEAMALAFLSAGVFFDVTTLRFKNDLNAEDIGRASEFCRKHNIRQSFIDLDVVSFYEKKNYMAYIDPYYCPSPEIATQLWFAEQIKRPFVWGGEAFRMYIKDDIPCLQAVSEVEAVIYRFIKSKNYNAIPNFHFFSAELAWSFFNKSFEYKNNFFVNDRSPEFYSEKFAFYRACGFPVDNNGNRKKKLHGFEGLKNHFDSYFASRKENITYNDYFRLPVIKKYPFQGCTYLDIPKGDVVVSKMLNLADLKDRD